MEIIPIKKYFYDPTLGFTSANKLYKKLKLDGYDVKLKDVKDFIQKQYTSQVNHHIQKPKHYSTIQSPSVGNNFQMDIMVYDRFSYHNYKYILVVVDVYSRYAEARPMTNRNMPTIMKKLRTFLNQWVYPLI